MRNRDYFLPSITTLILFGLVWFLSCAHQNRYRESTQDEFNQFAESGEEMEASGDEFASAPEEKSQDDFGEPEKWDSDTQDFASSQEQNETNNQDTESFPENSPENSNDEFAFAGETSSGALQENKRTDESIFSDDSVFSEGSDSAQEKSSGPVLVPLPNSDSAQETSQSDSFSPEIAESAVSDPEPESQARPVWVARTPQVPRGSFMKKGTRLNRFYFVRKGDSSTKLSRLIYGDTSYRKKLIAWNGARWLPGSMIFYSSPQNTDDNKMVSFYQENQISPEEYRVKKGDSLSAIALRKLGHTRSWKEVAVVNGIESPNALEAGQVLALYPRNLSAKESPMVAQAEKPTVPAFTPPPAEQIPVAQEPEPVQPIQAQAPVQQPQQAPEPQQPTQAPVAVAPREQPAEPRFQEPEAPVREQAEAEGVAMGSDVNWDQLVEQNFVAILIGAALIILLLALSARKKRKKNTASREDDSSSEPKSRFGRR